MSFSTDDKQFMKVALALATSGEGRVSPNPPVGCVIVQDGEIVGRGWHDRLGALHAEAMALQDAGERARGGTAYVTLSPCTTHGRQPPCSDALIRAGVGRVVVAAPDPNPRNDNGVAVLNAAGIPASAGLLQKEAEYLARGFFKVMRTGTPFVTLKYAMTLDGRIATESGDSKWISGEVSRAWVHDFRSRNDAVLVGIGTVLADDPLLTVRGESWEARGGDGTHKQPLRVVVDSDFRIPLASAMLQDRGVTLVAGVVGRHKERQEALRRVGAGVLEVEAGDDGRVCLETLMRALAGRGVPMVLCEPGGTLSAALLGAGLIDEVITFIAPKIIGGAKAPGPIGGQSPVRMADALSLEVSQILQLGDDLMVRGTPQYQKP